MSVREFLVVCERQNVNFVLNGPSYFSHYSSESLSLLFLVICIPVKRGGNSPGTIYLFIIFNVLLCFRSRNDVQTCTSWKAPIIWEGMFTPSHYDQIHRNKGSSVALTVFAVGRLTFLNSSEQHFMSSLPVTYYVFTDSPELVPNIKLAPNRHLKVIEVERHTRWQDISMMRMKAISDVIESDIRHHATHVFCFDVDQVFTGRFGPEALGDSVALLHAHYYHLPRMLFTYDHNPKSKAFMKTGDFYYHAAIFGGSWRSVKALTEACYRSIMADKENEVEALWHDESHLNKYFWLHKPSRVLSPEYCWDTTSPFSVSGSTGTTPSPNC
uniref:Alpha 1,3-galactosyltransferase 2 n=1 Tax=Poecilia latipinna TaxID=48699 RepID=A0A3B3V9U8_9TELE